MTRKLQVFQPIPLALAVAIALLLASQSAWAARVEPQKPIIQLTTIDAGPIGAQTTTNLYFAQVAVGGGYTTVFTLMNTGSDPVNGTLYLKDQQGADFSVSMSGAVTGVGSNFPI